MVALGAGPRRSFQILSRLRSHLTLYEVTRPVVPGEKPQRGRPRKYGWRRGSVAQCAQAFRARAVTYQALLYGKQRELLAFSQVVMLKTMKCPVRVVWVFRTSRYVALATTDLSLSVEQIIEFYGARWKIESGFKEIQQDIGSATSQTRTAHAVSNHLNFCLMATTLTWIYADRLQQAPERNHQIRGRTAFAFSDVRRRLAEAALHPDFQSLCPPATQSPQNPFVQLLLRMAA